MSQTSSRANPAQSADAHRTDRRNRARLSIEAPLRILRIDDADVNLTGMTRDMSSGGGVCFRAGYALKAGLPVQYIITLSGGNSPVRIKCSGRVKRCEETIEQGVWDIAVTMIRYQFEPVEN